MKIAKLIFLTIFTSISFINYGQVNMPTKDEIPIIEVMGTAELEIIPDEIFISIIIREKYVNRTKVNIEEQEEKLKSALKSIGVDLTNLFIADVNADYVRVRWQKKDVLTQKDYTLKVADAKTLGLVFQELEKLEINDAFISRINHTKIDSLKKEVKIMAIKAAKEKADYLLDAIGEKTGKALWIKENDIPTILKNMPGVFPKTSVSGRNIHQVDGVKIINENDEIEFQKIKLNSSIYAKFSIK